MRTLNVRLYLKSLLVLFVMLAFAANTYSKSRQELMYEEIERRQDVLELAREQHPTQQQLFMKLMEPVVRGNRQDYEKNIELANSFRERAQKAETRRMEETAEKYTKVARLFYELAQTNRKIVKAISEYDSDKLQEAFAEVKDIEQKIFDISGKQVKREWFTPEELQEAAKRYYAEKGGEELKKARR